jgi:hypothetical protein
MSKAITFFRNRQQETGQTYEFRVEGQARTYRVFVFSRKSLEEKVVQSRNLSKDGGGSIQPEIDKIRLAIQRSQGGAIAVIYEENRNRFLWAIPVTSQSEGAFDTIGILRPGHPSLNLEPLSASKGVVPFPAGAHALIPVDREAEESLRGFQDYLRYLPADLETLVLHAIRDPSLDTRVGLLEAVVRKDTTETSASKSWFLRLLPFLAKISWFKRPMPVWPAAAVLFGLLLTVNAILFYSILQSVNGSFVIPGMPRDHVTEGGEGGDGDEGSTTTVTPSQKIFALIAAARKSSNASLSALSQGHFSKVQTEGDLAKVLVPGEDGVVVARGLLKLEALRLDKAAAGDLFGGVNNPTQVNTFYQGRHLDARSRDMLAALACAAYGSPGLPKTQSAAAVPFADVGQGCKSFPLEKAAPGLDDLLKLVQGTK